MASRLAKKLARLKKRTAGDTFSIAEQIAHTHTSVPFTHKTSLVYVEA
jgi:hypothetical protein